MACCVSTNIYRWFLTLNENIPNAFQVVNNPSVIIQAYDKGVRIDGHFLNALQNETRKMVYYTTRNTALAIEQKVKELGINLKDDTTSHQIRYRVLM